MGIRSWWKGRSTASEVADTSQANPILELPGDVVGTLFDADRPRAIGPSDPLRRNRWIQTFEEQLKKIPVSDSFVFSLEGPWGSGKTSVLDTIESDLTQAQILVLRFNPWLFAGSHDLVGAFFRELAAQLKHKQHRFKSLAIVFNGLASLLGPIGQAAGSATLGVLQSVTKGSSEALSQASELRQAPSLLDSKRRFAQELAKSNTRTIVLIDDLERLTGREGLEVLRAVRVIADLPGIIYVLAFDREQLVKALQRDGEDVRFLDKIIQIPMRLPSPPPDALRSLLFQKLDALLIQLPHSDLNDEHWSELVNKVILPLIFTPRDVVRISNAVAAALAHLGNRVAIEEIVAMECLRITESRFFAALQMHRASLTTGDNPQVEVIRSTAKHDHRRATQRPTQGGSPEKSTAVREQLVSTASNRIACNSAIDILFPPLHEIEPEGHRFHDARPMRRLRRVATTEVFDLYFEADTHPDVLDLAFVEAIATLPTGGSLGSALNSVTSEQLTYLFRTLAEHAAGISERADMIPYLLVLLEHVSRLPVVEPAFFVERAELPVARLVMRILECLQNAEARCASWEAILDQASVALVPVLADISLTIGKHWVESLELTREEVDKFEERMRATVRTFDAAQFVAIRNPAWLLVWAFDAKSGTHREKMRALLANDELFSLVVSASFRRKRYSTGQLELEFSGEVFETTFEDEELRHRLSSLLTRDALPELEREALRAVLQSERSLLASVRAPTEQNDDS